MKPVKTDWPAQAFIISEQLFDSSSVEEVEATFADMQEMNLARLPFPRFDIILPLHKVLKVKDRETGLKTVMLDSEKERARWASWTMRVRVEQLASSGGTDYSFRWLLTKQEKVVDLPEFVAEFYAKHGFPPNYHPDEHQFQQAGEGAMRLLIVLLATHNTVKEVHERKIMRYGIGGLHHNRYTTTIKVGKVIECAGEAKGTGVERRPHLRRGHVRRQHYGPNNELVKSIFIQPVFVNADKGWIAERTAYNLSGSSRVAAQQPGAATPKAAV